MTWVYRITQNLLVLLIIVLASPLTVSAGAEHNTSDINENPTINIRYVWWMLNWKSNQIVCSVPIIHEGLPTFEEIKKHCGNESANEWLYTPPCNQSKSCNGVYMHLARTESLTNQSPTDISESTANIFAYQQQNRKFIDSCALIWQAQPPPGRPPWLMTPDIGGSLATYNDYYYLAGRLIANNIVKADHCRAGGLDGMGYANECGMDAARPFNHYWQNQFDPNIIDAAYEVGVPAQLMKNLFARESQFWPGTFYYPNEYGLGQITNNGVDVLFIWNTKFYNEFCPLILSKDSCSSSYIQLNRQDRDMLRGAVIAQINADCPDCLTGIDMDRTKLGIPFTANLLVANCHQVAEMVTYITDYTPGAVASYQDLWLITLANYHAGSGYISNALYKTWQKTGTLNWSEIASRIPYGAKEVHQYVEDIAQ